VIYWNTGQPGTGKTTLGRAWAAHLIAQGDRVAFVDADEVRELLPAGYDREGRVQNVDRIQAIVAYLHKIADYDHVVVANVAPYIEQRNAFKQRFAPDVVEVYLETNFGVRQEFAVDEYEPPLKPDMRLTGQWTLSNALLGLQRLHEAKTKASIQL